MLILLNNLAEGYPISSIRVCLVNQANSNLMLRNSKNLPNFLFLSPMGVPKYINDYIL